ncbi:MAG: chemotaxis protein CheW [Gammaproteobacteria bacterium]|nr:chemotaxis protein CheW [Gammaproteobacteria bacterium]
MQQHESLVDDSNQYLSFSLDCEEYGVDILRVQEIREWQHVRTLPDTPGYVKGVLDLRGIIVPIIDLRSRFNMDNVEYTATTVIIVLVVMTDDKQLMVGVVVDSVSDVLDIPAREIRSAPELGDGINTRYMNGMVTLDERMVILLDVDRMLSPEELGVLVAAV